MADRYETSYVKTGREGRRPRLCVTYHDADGKRHEMTRSAEPKRLSALKREAEEWRTELNREWDADELRRLREEEDSKIPTIDDYSETYIQDKLIEGIERSTSVSYGQYRKLVLDPDGGLRGLRMDRITPDACIAWIRHLMLERGLSAKYVSQTLIFLKQVMNRAELYGVIDRNPIAKVRGPKVRRDAPNALDRPSVSRLRKWIDGGGDWFRTAVAIALFTGMRRGEVCALRWRDVDLQSKSIRVEHAIGKSHEGHYLKAPKNGKTRSFDITDELVESLRRHYNETFEVLLGLYPPEQVAMRMPDLYVCGSIDGTWRDPSAINAHWCEVREELALRGFQRERCPFHDLRHTFITYMLIGGTQLKSLMDIVGHSSASMTLDVYAGADPTQTNESSSSAGAMLPCDVEETNGPVYMLPSDAQ